MRTQTTNKIKKQTITMLFIVLGMFGFCYALVPMYNVFCQVTGLNGKTDGQVAASITKVDTSRTVTVELLATLNSNMSGHEFIAQDKKFTLHPGEYVTTSYRVGNHSDHAMTVQAIPSVTPGLAARHIKKVECFCFTKQPLNPLEQKNMPLTFTVDPALPNGIHTITLAYTLFDVTQ